MLKLHPAASLILAGLAVGLSACGGAENSSENASGNPATASQASQPNATVAAAALNLSAGPDVCFRAITKHLGQNAQVSEINSFFSSGSEIDSSDDEPKGQVTVCSAQYQNPDDPRKLLSVSLDTRSGEFSAPSPVEITVSGGDAAAFKLEDHLIPLSNVNAAALTSIMDAQKAKLGSVYSRYAWSGVRLMSPDTFSDVHILRLDVEGRLASNDVKESGYAEAAVDGKVIDTKNLYP
jgi:hypothetical protein